MNEPLHYDNEPFFCIQCNIQLRDKSKPVCSDDCADKFEEQCKFDIDQLQQEQIAYMRSIQVEGVEKMTNPEPFITKCALCGGELRLLKDPKAKAYHGDCWAKLKKKVGEK